MVEHLKNLILGFVYPRRCPICDEMAPIGEMICPECMKLVKTIGEPTCKRCGKPVDDNRAEYCYDCAKKHHEFRQGKAVFLYQKGIKESMYRFKYSNKREYADFYAREAVRLYGHWMEQHQIDVILPVPMYRGKERLRGYNQAEVFARALGSSLKIPVEPNLVKRVRNTIPQKQLNDVERKNNLKGAFKINPDIVKYKKVLLVDDIYTTGSTMDAMAKEISDIGIEDIYFLCISIGVGC